MASGDPPPQSETWLGQGRENAKEYIRQNTDVAGALEEQIRGNMFSFRTSDLNGIEEEEDLEEEA